MKITEAELLKVFGPDRGQALARLFARKVIPKRQKVLCSAACLQAVGDTASLASLLEMALADSSALNPIYETLLQGYLFCGYPRAIESFFCLEHALVNRGLSIDMIRAIPLESAKTLLERGKSTAKAVHKDKFERIHNKISAISPDLGYLMIAEGYGHILCRPGLDLQARELDVISCLTALGAGRQLNSHIRGALNAGCKANEAFEAILLCAPWLEAERVRAAADIWADITGGDVNSLVSAYKLI
jgi:4-carboxymuconolactone decarboxylase